MKISNLNEMTKGWFIGDFKPTLCATQEVEVAVKKYRKGDCEGKHFHRIATEFTIIVSGRVRMNGQEFSSDDIVTIIPEESTDFEALEDTITVVVKMPGATNDKYLGEAK